MVFIIPEHVNRNLNFKDVDKTHMMIYVIALLSVVTI